MSPAAVPYLLLSAALLGILFSAALALLFYPSTNRWLARGPRLSSASLFGIAVFPPVVGAVLALNAVGSGWLSAQGWVADHCPTHPGHPHLCLAHIAQNPPGGLLFWLALGVAGSWLFVNLVRVCRADRRLSGTLGAAVGPEQGYFVVPSRIPAAFTAGVFRPRIYLTTRALELLDADEKALVLAHESEHARRRDPLKAVVLAFWESCFPPLAPIRRRWQLAVETECDRHTVLSGFEPARVAGTILKLARANREPLAAAAWLHYARSDPDSLRCRVEALFADPDFRRSSRGLWTLPAFLALSLMVLSSEVHHGLETVLGWLS